MVKDETSRPYRLQLSYPVPARALTAKNKSPSGQYWFDWTYTLHGSQVRRSEFCTIDPVRSEISAKGPGVEIDFARKQMKAAAITKCTNYNSHGAIPREGLDKGEIHPCLQFQCRGDRERIVDQ